MLAHRPLFCLFLFVCVCVLFWGGIKLWSLMTSFPCFIFYLFWVRIELITRACGIHCFYAGKKMQNLSDLLSRCFINPTGQILVVDLVNLSFRNTLLTFFLSSCSPLSVGTHWHPPHPCWVKLFCCREGSGKLSRTCQLGKASSCLGTKMSRSSLISHQAISMLDKSLSIGLHCIP